MTNQLIKIAQKSGAVLVAMTLVFSPVVTNAATVASQYQPSSIQEMIAYLYGIIAQLQAQLDAQNGRSSTASASNSSGIGVARPGSSSSNNSSNRSEVEVETLSATNIDEEEADLRGRVDLGNKSYAYVWFEYGLDRDMDETTSKRKVTDSRNGWQTFSANIDDLDYDEKYYFRAVSEDSRGDRDYGSVRTFVTEDSGNSGSNSHSSYGYELSVDDSTVNAKDTVQVHWRVPSDEVRANNWVGLYEASRTNNREYNKWQHTGSRTSGTMNFEIFYPGQYEFRLFLNSEYDDKATVRVTVK